MSWRDDVVSWRREAPPEHDAEGSDVDNDGPGDLDLEWDTDHGGIMGGLRTVSQPWFKTFNPWSRFLVATQLQFTQPYK